MMQWERWRTNTGVNIYVGRLEVIPDGQNVRSPFYIAAAAAAVANEL